MSRRQALMGLAALSASSEALAETVAVKESPPPVAQDAVLPVSEDEIIAEVLRYLKLSRTQLMAVLDTGRHIRRRMAMTSQAQERARREAEQLNETNQAEAQRRFAALDGERAQAESEVALYGASRLTRILDRLQIGLAWKLGQGQPPKWTRFDPRILQHGGFQGPRAEIFLLSTGLNLADRTHRLTLPEGDFVVGDYDALGQPVAVERLYARLSDDVRAGFRFIPRQPGGDGRPFAQRLAEVPDPSVLAQEIQPCARRLFLSERLVDVVEAMMAGRIAPPSTRRPSLPSGNPRLAREFKMEQGLGDQSRRGPDLEPLGGELRNGSYAFPAGKGLYSDDLGVTDHYALQFVFRCVKGSGYQKLIDFKDREVDGGLYTHQNQFTFYMLAQGGAPIEGEQRLLIQRNRQTRLVQVYVDFRPAFAFIDLDDDAVFQDKRGWFFVDDKSTNGEHGPGAMRWLTVSTGPLSR